MLRKSRSAVSGSFAGSARAERRAGQQSEHFLPTRTNTEKSHY